MSHMSHRITENGEALWDEVVEGLRVFNEGIAGPYDLRHVRLAIRADGPSIAGLVGLCYWNMLHVDVLWVAPTHRRSGCGTALLQRAEQIIDLDVPLVSVHRSFARGFPYFSY